MTLPLVTAHDRAPDWKWSRITGITSRGEPASTPEWDSENGFYWISRGVDFLRSYNADPDPMTNRDLLIKYADIFAAYRVYTDENSYLRYELEALVLSREPSAAIAMRSNMTTASMVAYEELFFDVRSLLDKDTYIRNCVIGKTLQKITKFDLGVIWKLYGYYFGPLVLKTIVSRTANPQFVQTPDAVSASLNEDIMGSFKIACAIAAKNPAGGDEDNRHLLGLFAKFAEIDKMEDMSSGSHQGQIKEHVGEMLNSLIFTIGGIYPRGTSAESRTSPMYQYKDYAVDPDLSQLTELALKGSSESLDKFKDMDYPPIPKKTK